MRTPKRLYSQERIIYQPELLTCPHCGNLLRMCNYLAWDKTVQTLDRVVSVASRPGHCPRPSCVGSRMHLVSAEAQGIAFSGSTYGYDVLVRLGWWRQQYHATYREIHADLATRVRISESHVRYLYQRVYLPLLACQERQYQDRLAQVAKQQGGLIIALDGLAPQGGEPHIWFIRELTSGLTLRSGWLSQQDQPTFEAFLKPLNDLAWPILAVLSDKQTGLMPAVATVLPHSRYQFCQAHYLRNLAEPLAEADAAFKVALRKTVRQQVGALIRQEPRPAPGQAGVLTVTGLLPSPLGAQQVPTAPDSQRQAPSASFRAPTPAADEIITHLFRHTRYLLTLKGRPPFRLAGIETYERLEHVARFSLDLLAQHYDPRLAQLYQGLQSALSPFAQTYQEMQQGAAWLHDIAYILEPALPHTLRGEQVAAQLRGYLDTLRLRPEGTPTLYGFALHLDKVSRSYWPGLFHCYDVPGLARTNNELESRFRDTNRRLLRTTGQQGLTQRTLQRQGAWELLPRLPTEAQLLEVVCQIPAEELAQERQRFAEHRQRFRMQSRSLKQTQTQFNQLRQRWAVLQVTGTG
ncbi:MAG TPA: transposase [Candidatus Saccharimonadia bacterium]|nr:transposase [Candidatus Saccharimonadia bacterium]